MSLLEGLRVLYVSSMQSNIQQLPNKKIKGAGSLNF